MLKILTRENITLFLSILGSVGTVSGWFYHWMVNRKNLTFKVSGHCVDNDGLFIYFQITNNSRLSITINAISLFLDNKEIYCRLTPDALYTIQHGSREERILLTAFPLSLAPLYGASGCTYFPFEPETKPPASNTLAFVIRTNRGRAIKTQLPLGEYLSELAL